MNPAADSRQPVRLQKFISDAGVASRRHAEELILEGRVLVNDTVVEALPAFVDPRRDRVVVDGTPVHVQPHEYFIINKPRGVVCTNRDPAGRPRAVDLLPPLPGQLFPVGRLDADSTGLLLMTNDGELAERITHPRYGMPKVYRAEVAGHVSADLPERLRKGVYLSDGKARASYVEIVHTGRERSILEITLREGRNRQVRRMLARVGHKVYKLRRIGIGPLSLKGLPIGASRRLGLAELHALREAARQSAREDARAARKPQRRRRAEVPVRRTGGEGRRGTTRGKPSAPPRRLIT